MGTLGLLLKLFLLLLVGVEDIRSEFYPFMATRTAYQLVHGFAGRPEASCKPIQLWTVVRHGARYPDRKILQNLLKTVEIKEKIIQNHERGRGSVNPEILEKLRNWKLDPSVNMSVAGNLSVQGKVDVFNYAQRIKSVFPELLDKNYSEIQPNEYVFQATRFERAKLSLTAFAEGLYGKVDFDPAMIVENETLLHFYGHCPAWYATYGENKEWEKFKTGPEATNLALNVSMRLGFRPNLDYATVKSIFEICRYELAWFPERQSPWCDLFTTEDIKLFEYAEDLDYYYYCGPGRPMSKLIGCGLLKDMLERFGKLEGDDYENQPKGVFYFGHSTTLHTVFAAMDIGKEEEPILSTNYATSANRNYRTTFLGPFASNLMAVFYKCKGYESPNKVMFYVAEKVLTFPECKNGLCDWDMIKTKYAPRVTPDVCSEELCQ